MAISRWRAVALASSRFATFAQAISKTTPTTLMSANSESPYVRRNAGSPFANAFAPNVVSTIVGGAHEDAVLWRRVLDGRVEDRRSDRGEVSAHL